MHKEGLFWQNRAYPAGRSTLPALETALTWAGAACCGDAADQLGVIRPTSVCEPGASSHGVSAAVAKTTSPAAVRTPRCGRTGGGLHNVSVVVLVAVMQKSVALGGFKTPTIR
jgi:hypothetical protein